MPTDMFSVYEVTFILASDFCHGYCGRNFGSQHKTEARVMVEGKRRGRPPSEPGEAKRASFNTRLRPSLKLALEAAAKQEGRSLSEEIEFRLERSLDAQHQLIDALGLAFGRQVAALVLLVGLVAKETVFFAREPRRPGHQASISNAFVFGQVTMAINGLLRRIEPAESYKAPPPGKVLFTDELPDGVAVADSMVDLIADPEREDADLEEIFDLWGPAIRKWLGHAAVARIRATALMSRGAPDHWVRRQITEAD
jgi:predicted HicB family RNase H-like nuclease